jgi:hypothetical protein
LGRLLFASGFFFVSEAAVAAVAFVVIALA